jgi:hypothetical protein
MKFGTIITLGVFLVLLATPSCRPSEGDVQHKGGAWHFTGFTEVRAYRLNWDDEYSFDKILTNDGALNTTRQPTDGVVLNESQEKRLEAAVTGSHPDHPVAACFYPHHAFLFFGAEGKIVGHIDVCFLCSNYAGYPKGFASSWDLDAIRSLVEDLGMPTHNKDWD